MNPVLPSHIAQCIIDDPVCQVLSVSVDRVFGVDSFGIYFYRMTSAGSVDTKKMLLMK